MQQAQQLAQGGHWYALDGTPMYQIRRKDGKGYRPTTLRDARVLGLVPSVTKIISILDKPELDHWKMQQILEAGASWRNEPIDKAAWIALVKEEGERKALQSRQRGQVIHAGIEAHLKEETFGNEFALLGEQIRSIMQKHGSITIEAEKSFATRKYGGYGGKIDLWSTKVIADIKTTEFELVDGVPHKNGKKARLHRPEHAMQLIGYAVGTTEDKPPPGKFPALLNIFVSTTTDEIHVHYWQQDELVQFMEVYRRLVELWWLLNP